MEIPIVVCLFRTVTPTSHGWRCKTHLFGWDVGLASGCGMISKRLDPSGDLRLGLSMSHEKSMLFASSEFSRLTSRSNLTNSMDSMPFYAIEH